MGVSKKQREKVKATCQCGCGETFYPFPVYGKKGEGLIYPIYIRGHHPNSKTNAFTKGFVSWNTGLTKAEYPALERMGYQKGHIPYNNWDKVHELQRNDKEFMARKIANTRYRSWNRGKTLKDYDKPVPRGADHANWCGGRRGVVDTSAMATLRDDSRKRDNYTCQHCGDRNYVGRGSRIRLEMHHIVPVTDSHELALDLNNVITLCSVCHRLTETYGAKQIKLRRKQSGK